jgi:phenylpropionate dioxygenase-like ring-hydroxylating dioxygenase large terminal subunit
MTGVFMNPGVVSQSWYPAVRSTSIPRGAVRAFDLGRRRLAVYRGQDGRVHVIDARCPHLGADLAQGRVDANGIRCAFHGWTFDANGRCCHAPGHDALPDRQTRVYPIEERWGFVWVFNGPTPRFELPASDPDVRWRAIALRPQRVACHPHLVLANGLDVTHYESLHGMRFSAPSRLTVGDRFDVSVELRGRPQSRLWQLVSGTRSREIVARFTTIGGSLAWSSVRSPVRFDVVFTGRPDREGRCITQTIFLFPTRPGPDWLRAVALLATLLHDDRRVLDSIDFRPSFSDADEPLKAFARVVDALGAW